MTYHVITLFPGAFDSYLGESILKRAIEDKKIKVKFYNPRDFADNTYKRIDQKPYAGGPGMVVQALPVIEAIEKAIKATKLKGVSIKRKIRIVWFTPSGRQFDTAIAKEYGQTFEHVIFVCGRYEGIDARVKEVYAVDEMSVGPYVLTGGELPAMLMIDSISRQVEGVLGDIDSLEESRVASPDVYTRPEVFTFKKKKYAVPEVLLSGNHKLIEAWKVERKNKA